MYICLSTDHRWYQWWCNKTIKDQKIKKNAHLLISTLRALRLTICLHSSDDTHLSSNSQHQSFELPNRTKTWKICTTNHITMQIMYIFKQTHTKTHMCQYINFSKLHKSSDDYFWYVKIFINVCRNVIYVNNLYSSAPELVVL